MSQSMSKDQNPTDVTNAINVATLSTSLDSIKHAATSDNAEGDPHLVNAPPSIYADYVIVFDYGKATLQDTSKKELVEKNYADLLRRLRKQGLKVEVRTGNPGTLLLFVLCPWARLTEAIHTSRLTDWLHGVGSIKSSSPEHIDDYPISDAERLRTVYTLITGASDNMLGTFMPGCGIIPNHHDFPQVSSIMPIHNPAFNRTWLSKLSRKYLLDMNDINQIRDHFGEQLALYFSFLQFYFLALSVPTALGILAFVLDRPYSLWYGAASIIWSSTVVETWKQRQSSLAISWGCQGCRKVEQKRAAFRGFVRSDPISGLPVKYFPWWKREAYRIAALPVMAAFALSLAMILTCIFSVEVFITEAYQGPGKQYLGILPTVLFTLAVPNFIKLYQKCALYLTELENHETESAQDQHLTSKVFVLNFFTAYLGLFLTAYIYIPLGKAIVPRLSLLDFSGTTKADALQYTINPSRLKKHLFSLMVISQGINFGTEVILPFVMRFGYSKVQDIQKHTSAKKPHSTAAQPDKEGERAFLERVRREVSLPEESLFIEFAEMVTQFGYVSLFGVIWPLAPLAAFVNNWFELRGDAAKIALNARRAHPVRTDSIGPWIESMKFISWLSALTTSSLVYLFRPGLKHSQAPIKPYVEGDNLIKSSSLSSEIESLVDPVTCLKTLIVIIFAEHIQAFISRILGHVIRRIFEEDASHVRQRKLDWDAKQTLIRKHLDARGHPKAANIKQHREVGSENLNSPEEEEKSPFWSSAIDGQEILRSVLSKKDA